MILSNHPKAGGSHLPDLTVITPVFYPCVHRIKYFIKLFTVFIFIL